jgi:chitosanase
MIVLLFLFGFISRVQAQVALSAEQHTRIERLTTLFENDTTEFQYSYIENLHDGRGYTAGRVGFTSATGDLFDVVSEYLKVVPKSPLSKYLKTLETLAKNSDGSTKGLKGFPAAWKKANSDKKLRDVQDHVAEETYFSPALSYAKSLGLTLPSSVAILYDTLIQHGDGGDPDGFGAIVDQTTTEMHGIPSGGIGEQAWVKTFLKARRKVLEHSSDPETRKVWAESVGRCDVLRDVFNRGLDFSKPFHISVGDYDNDIP